MSTVSRTPSFKTPAPYKRVQRKQRTTTNTNHMLICVDHIRIFDHMLKSRRPSPPVVPWTQLSMTRDLSPALLPQHGRFPQLPTTWAAFWGCRQHHPRCRQGALLRYPFLCWQKRIGGLQNFNKAQTKAKNKYVLLYIHSNYYCMFIIYPVQCIDIFLIFLMHPKTFEKSFQQLPSIAWLAPEGDRRCRPRRRPWPSQAADLMLGAGPWSMKTKHRPRRWILD